MENQKTLVQVRGLKKAYRSGEIETPVLRGVDFDVYEGEFLCITGASGSGKTTILNIIGGMDTADAGSVRFQGRELFRADKKTLTRYRRSSVGFIFQSYNLMPNLTARQNLELIAELIDDPMDCMQALAAVGLEGKENSYPSQLSGGQQQRVSIARALVKRPKLILADEPTAALDHATGVEVLSALENVVASGTTLVMVTHNEQITRMANRVLHIRSGTVYDTLVNADTAAAAELIW